MATRWHVMQRAGNLGAALTILVLTGSLPAQEIPAAAAAGPSVRLQAHEGKSEFYIGERVELDLVFRNATPDSYTLNNTDYGDLADKVEISPAKGWTQWQTRSGHDYASDVALGAAEVRIPIVLSEGFIFTEPGYYEIRVTTNRLSRGAELRDLGPYGPVTSNAVGIHLSSMPAQVEEEQVKSLMPEAGSFDTRTREGEKAHRDAVARLAALPGDDALRAKIRLILEEDGDMRQVRREALASTRNLALQLSLLQAAWKNPAIAPVLDLPDSLEETRALMRGQTMPGFAMAGPPPDASVTAKAAEEHKADMEDLLRSLPMRSGDNRRAAAYYLMEDRSLPAADVAAAKPVAIEEFRRMNDVEQHMLLETAWPAIRDEALRPVLEAMLDKNPTDKDALERLIELDPEGAKDYVVRAVCDQRFYVPLDAVAALPSMTLPEVDGCLGNLLREPPEMPADHVWKTRAELAARFASPAILPAARQGWKSPEQDSAMLPLLLRYAPEEAVALIRRRSSGGVTLFYESNRVFKSLGGGFPKPLTSWLRHEVQDGPDDLAGTAAYELSQGGAPEDRALIEQRLAKARAQWTDDADDAAAEAVDSPASRARKLDVELMSDLSVSVVWKLSDADAAQLAAGCLSDQCRQYGKRPEARN